MSEAFENNLKNSPIIQNLALRLTANEELLVMLARDLRALTTMLNGLIQHQMLPGFDRTRARAELLDIWTRWGQVSRAAQLTEDEATTLNNLKPEGEA